MLGTPDGHNSAGIPVVRFEESAYAALEGRRAVVLGGAGFVGSHLCERMLALGARVTCIDNFITGSPDNVAHLGGPFDVQQADISSHLDVPGPVDYVLHLATPASPVSYQRYPIETLDAGSLGTRKALELATEKGASFLLASTSEVYGSPAVNPQPESYWGHVNPTGPRSMYDESKRFAEALTVAWGRQHGLPIRIARLFNTYGPRMRFDDGRVIPEFMRSALLGVPLPVHGDGNQTRSLCYVGDTVEGLIRLLLTGYESPVNIGRPEEVTMINLARVVQKVVGRHPGVTFLDRPGDDPQVRKPDTRIAEEVLGWTATTSIADGLKRSLGWFESGVERHHKSTVIELHVDLTEEHAI